MFRLPDGSLPNTDVQSDTDVQSQNDLNILHITSSSSPSPEIEMIDEILCSPNKDNFTQRFSELESLSLVSLSVIGVRFRCPHCEYIDINLKFVRDHIKDQHRGKKNKDLQPRRQEMKVKIKSRISMNAWSPILMRNKEHLETEATVIPGPRLSPIKSEERPCGAR